MKQLLLALLLLISTPVSADTLSNEINVESVLAVMNEYRTAAGLMPLRQDSKLTRAAEGRMQDMVDGGWWAHQSPDGTSPFVWLSIADYRHSMAGENLAKGFDTARVLVETWMESPGHRANIMNAVYADCGIAILEGSTSGPAMGKSVVVLFGRRLAESVAAK
jgi:uncharacterized protein YkwD